MDVTVSGTGRAVTLADVAAAAGVSISAVSMALADHPRIGVATKENVRMLAQELGYVTNSAARALRSQRSATIALIVPNTGQHVFNHPYFMQLLLGVSEVLNSHDISLLVSTNPDGCHGVAAYERVLRSKAADGAIVASAAVDDTNIIRLAESGLHAVLIGNYPVDVDAVLVEDVAGARVATEHLISHGRRMIAHISGPLNHQTSLDRLEGFRLALAEAGRAASESPVAAGDFDEETGATAAKALLDRYPAIDGIFAANDEMAYGVLVEIKRRGLRVPEDIALIGYDDFGVSRITTPAVTTISVPAAEVGRRATVRLLQVIEKRTPFRREVLPVSLTIRDSCGCSPPR